MNRIMKLELFYPWGGVEKDITYIGDSLEEIARDIDRDTRDGQGGRRHWNDPRGLGQRKQPRCGAWCGRLQEGQLLTVSAADLCHIYDLI